LTIKDVAKEAGVSIATVSRVLNLKKVRHGSQQKVEVAIKKLGFVPNALAQGLMQKKTKTLGILITSMTNAYYTEITEVIEKRLRETESMLFLSTTDGNPAQEKRYLDSLVSRQVEGIIMIDPTIENFENGVYHQVAQRVPLVLVHSFQEITGLNSVYIDQYAGMEKVMDYLWSLGHRRIAFLRGNHGHSFDLKEDCWRRFFIDHQIQPPEDLLVTITEGNNDNAIQMATRACAEVLAKDQDLRPTAIFACNDLMALGALSASQGAGLVVPRDLSIVGHDNTNLAKSSLPLLTTVDLKLSSLGNEAIDLLFQGLEDPTESHTIFVEPDLIVRRSTSSLTRGNP
jgi:LacI family transcriptional regulator